MAFETGPFLNLAVFCETVIQDTSGVLSLIRVVDRMKVAAHGPNAPEEMPPTQLSWTMVLHFRAGSARGSYPIKILPELPSGLSKEPIILSAHFEGGNRGINIISKVNMTLDMPGVYWFKIFLNDVFVTQVPVEIIYSRVSGPAAPA